MIAGYPWLDVLIAAIVCGVIGMAVAQAKRASMRQAFAWGFVLGPIGWIIAALVLKPLEIPSGPPAAVTSEQAAAKRRLAVKLAQMKKADAEIKP